MMIFAILLVSPLAFADEPTVDPVGVCRGYTDDGKLAEAVLSANDEYTEGLILVAIDKGKVYSGHSLSKVRTDEFDGFPHFYDNQYGIDVILSDEDPSYSDIKISDELIVKDTTCDVLM